MSQLLIHGATKGLRNSSGSGIPSMHMEGPQNPYLNVNRMIFVWAAWTYYTNKVRDLVPMDFLSLLPGESVYICDSEDVRNESGRAHGWTNMADGLIGNQ